ncbi:MAG TPA: cytochrome c [Acidiferrobacterales bacterium]|nr:cytochrome c [Acidiferrobacterales bacterium]
MRRVFIVTSLFIIVCLTLTPVEKAGAADDSAASGAAVRGQKLYMQNMCYTCHGTVGQGGERTGPKLAPNPFPYMAFAAQVRKPRQDMPKYPQQFLSDQGLADIYAYILSIKPGPATKDIPVLK